MDFVEGFPLLYNILNKEGSKFCKPYHIWSDDIDHIMRFENLREEFKFIQNKVNCDVPLFHKKRSSVRKHYKEHYNDAAINFVGEKYKKEIETFNYTY